MSEFTDRQVSGQNYVDAEVISAAGQRGYFGTRQRNMAGNPVSDAIIETMSDPNMTSALGDAVSDGAQKFVASDGGQALVSRFTGEVALLGAVCGAGVMYWWLRGRK